MRWQAAIGALALAAAACTAQPPPGTDPPAEPAGWSDLPAGPLSARYGAAAFWTGREMVVLGGTDAAPCPANADCAAPVEPPLRDGAAFDPATGRWRRVADAPRPLLRSSGAVAGDSIYVLGDDTLLRYRLAADQWESLPGPPGDATLMHLVGMGSNVLAALSTQEFGVAPDSVFDSTTDTWTALPVDPLADAYDRTAVWTGREVVLLGIPIEARAADEPPLFAAAVLDPTTGVWRRLPDSRITGGGGGAWTFVAGRIVNASIGRADGGEVNNWGAAFPFGGVLGGAGAWEELPDPPDVAGGFPGVAAGVGDVAIADGWALRVSTGRWTEIPAPDVVPSDAATVWTGDRLIVWGGVAWNGVEATVLDRGMAWRP